MNDEWNGVRVGCYREQKKEKARETVLRLIGFFHQKKIGSATNFITASNLKAGQSIKIEKNTRVQYSNPFDEDCEYVAICLPAFSIDLANRE